MQTLIWEHMQNAWRPSASSLSRCFKAVKGHGEAVGHQRHLLDRLTFTLNITLQNKSDQRLIIKNNNQNNDKDQRKEQTLQQLSPVYIQVELVSITKLTANSRQQVVCLQTLSQTPFTADTAIVLSIKSSLSQTLCPIVMQKTSF